MTFKEKLTKIKDHGSIPEKQMRAANMLSWKSPNLMKIITLLLLLEKEGRRTHRKLNEMDGKLFFALKLDKIVI
ncbi:MAG: hypothetical protein ACOC35_03000 [Promethearchaeia archaeon]